MKCSNCKHCKVILGCKDDLMGIQVRLVCDKDDVEVSWIPEGTIKCAEYEEAETPNEIQMSPNMQKKVCCNMISRLNEVKHDKERDE